MTITGAEILVKCLEKHNVNRVFGYPGGAILPVYEKLKDSSIEHILVRGEQAAVHAASGYARVNRQVGVCIATSGPGATNLVTGLATAFLDSIPVIAITGQVSSSLIGTDAFQEVDITGITQPVTKHNYLVTKTADIAKVMEEAFYIASTGRPGPVLIDIPKDVAEGLCEDYIPEKVDLPGYKTTYKGHPAQIKTACKLLANAQRPLIYAGGGVINSHAEKLLLALAERLNAPVTTSLMGLGGFPGTHELYLGMLGIHGLPAANMAVSKCDVLLNVGARFADRVTGQKGTFAPEATVIHIDIDPAEIGKNINANVPIVGDVSAVLEDILEKLEQQDNSKWLDQVHGFRALDKLVYDHEPSMAPNYILERFNQLADGEAIITTDVGQHQMMAAQICKSKHCPGFISSGGLGTMGYGLPAAIGVQMAAGNQQLVVCITGDGSLQMSLPELATAKAHNLPLKVLLLNNSCLGMVRQLEYFYANKEYFAVDMPGNPDFLKLADAYGVEAYRIEDVADIDPVLNKALHNGKLTLIECVTHKDSLVLPMVLTGDSLDQMVLEG